MSAGPDARMRIHESAGIEDDDRRHPMCSRRPAASRLAGRSDRFRSTEETSADGVDPADRHGRRNAAGSSTDLRSRSPFSDRFLACRRHLLGRSPHRHGSRGRRENARTCMQHHGPTFVKGHSKRPGRHREPTPLRRVPNVPRGRRRGDRAEYARSIEPFAESCNGGHTPTVRSSRRPVGWRHVCWRHVC